MRTLFGFLTATALCRVVNGAGTRGGALAVPTRSLEASGVALPDQPMLLFIAGLEGQGHNYFDAVVQRISNLTTEMFLLKGNWNWRDMEATDQSWSEEDVATNTAFLRETAAAHPGKMLWIWAAGTSSYPNGHGSHESRMYRRRPSLSLLRQATEQAGIELRVLALHRNAADTLTATCVHRQDLEDCKSQAETLAENAGELFRQLSEQHIATPSSIRCVQYGDIENLGEGLAAALSPGSEAESNEAISAAADAWRLANDQAGVGSISHHTPSDELDADVVAGAKKMSKPLQLIEDFCSNLDESTTQDSRISLRNANLAHILPRSLFHLSRLAD